MDEMKLNLGSKLMRRLAAKLISKYLRKQLGVKVNIDLNELKVSYTDGDAVIKSDLGSFCFVISLCSSFEVDVKIEI